MIKDMLVKVNMEYVQKVFAIEIPKISDELELNQIPTLKWDSDANCVMCARHTTYVKSVGFFNKVIEHTEPEYAVYVNPEVVSKGIAMYKLMFGKKAEYDYVRTLLAHECRHIWQAQSNYWEGKPYDDYTDIRELVSGHGSLPEEVDANDFARRYMSVRNKASLPLVDYLTYEQSTTMLSNAKEANAQYAMAVKKYNPSHAQVVKCMGIIK